MDIQQVLARAKEAKEKAMITVLMRHNLWGEVMREHASLLKQEIVQDTNLLKEANLPKQKE